MRSRGNVPIYRFGPFVLDTGRGALLGPDGAEIALRARSFALLRLMVENAGRLMARSTIMEAVWPNIHVTDDNITQCIHEIRDALDRSRHLLRTVPRRGYILDATVTEDVDARPGSPAPSLALTGSRENRPPVSIAVLPLLSLDGSGAGERLADHITADLVTDLVLHLSSLMPEAQVLFRADAQVARQTTSWADQADYVLRGTIRPVDRCQVRLHVLHAASESCIWAERGEPFADGGGTDRLAQTIAQVLLRDVARRIEERPDQSLAAPDLVLLGQAWLRRSASPGNVQRALRCFERALVLAPDSCDAQLGIGSALVSMLSNGWSQSIARDEARTDAALRKVLTAGGDVALAHAINGTLRRLQGRLAESRVALETSLALAPHFAMAASQLGITMLYEGQPEVALSWFERGAQVAPENPARPQLLHNLGFGRVMAGDIERAIDPLLAAAAGMPEHTQPPLLLAAVWGLRSERAQAAVALRQAVGLCPAFATRGMLRDWVARQGTHDFMQLYRHSVERGLEQAGMPEA